MSKSIYKYVGPTSVQKVFALDKQVTLKCSYPKDFNDPYELFLTVDFNEQPDILAFYADAVGELPQLPTTCFSLSPSVVPMWAHYAQNLEGFVIEFDEEKLAGYFPESGFGDVDYQDVSDAGLTDMLYRASEIGKPRYVYLLRKGVFSAAYYTKATCWNYEQERRMILPDSETRKVDNIILMDVPNDCVTALISGPRSSGETITALRAKATEIGCNYFEIKIGRTSTAPFFINSSGNPFSFDGTNIAPSIDYCASCKEPIPNNSEECSWCRIEDTHKTDAAKRNPYRMYAQFGVLESYIKSMDSVGQEKK